MHSSYFRMRIGKYGILFVSFFSMFSFLFSMQSIPPLLPTMIEGFNLSYTLASSLMWLVALPGLFLSIVGGLLTGKYGVKPLSIGGLSIMTASSILFLLSRHFPLLQFSRFLLGVGGALVVVSVPSLIFQWFEREELGAAMGIFGLSMPVATVVSFNTLGVLSSKYGWKASILATAMVNILALVLAVLLIREKSDVRHERMNLAPLGDVNIWVLGAIWALFNMAAIGYTTWGKTIFVRYDGLSMVLSDLLASLLMLGAFITPLTGFISDRLGKRRPLIIASSLTMFMIFLLFPYTQTTYLMPLALIVGFLAAFLPPALFALPEEILGAGKGALGFGVLNTFLNLGVIMGPLTIGYVLDLTDSKLLGFSSMAFFALSASILASLLKTK